MNTENPENAPEGPKPSRRKFLTAIGMVAGADTLYQAMTTLGYGAETQFNGPPQLSGTRAGASVLVLGAGLAGLLAAYELSKAGYKVQILEYQHRAGGRNWTLYGGDTYTELGGHTQKVAFAPGNYLNPGPWRIPYHHRTLLHYCKAFNVALEPFVQFNHNAYVHATKAFGGKPVRFNAAAADFEGNVAELLAKAVDQKALDQELSKEDREKLLEALRMWGMLDKDMRYVSGLAASSHRGYDRPGGGGVNGEPIASKNYAFSDVLDSGVWRNMAYFMSQEMQTTMFQPVGGMGMIGKAFEHRVGKMITYNAKVTKIIQDKAGVTVTYTDMGKGVVSEAKADYCICTIPLGVLNQIQNNLSPAKQAAIAAIPYGPHLKIGLEMRRRFWEDDDYIYGGHSFTDQDIALISYPNNNMFKDGPAVILGAYAGGGAGAYRLEAMTPDERIEAALTQGSVFHPNSYRKEFISGASVAWSRVPWTMGSCARWTEETRKTHYQELVALDDRIVLAGEHASYVGCWMEGAVLSSVDAITRLHKRALEA
ncbi:MAG TPA: flavin monoamine oxidase family protein [Rhizomicrobium sp.]|nr:flavin monoamine oxidase family protein [Rhizomicrobium sp.]